GKKKVATTEISLYGKYVIFKTGGNGISFSKKLDKANGEKKKAYSDALSEIAAPYGFECRTGIFDAPTDAVFAEAKTLKERYLSLLEKYTSAPICSMIFSGYDLFGRLKIDLDADAIDRVYMNVSPERFSEDEAFWKKSDGGDNIIVNPVDDFFAYYGFSGEIADRDQPVVKLPHGGNLVIESTRAMTVIDVNAAGAYSASRGAESNAKAVNLDACSAIARELRFRNIGGTVVIDFISMQREENKKAVMEKLIAECAKDRFRIDVSTEMSPLGLAELCRIYR
ncbi:MAG: ribonuclease E/G, partial [Clostridia bacterium]|nr:ribonuclease E/G [Clostridia bacterium]